MLGSVLTLGLPLTAGLLASLFMGRVSTVLVVFVTAYAITPRDLLSLGSPIPHFGVAGSQYAVSTFAVAIALLIVLTPVDRNETKRDGLAQYSAILAVLLPSALLVFWPSNQIINVGIIHYALALLAFIAGGRLRVLLRRDQTLQLFLKLVILAFALQIAFQITQSLVPQLFVRSNAFLYLAEGRTFGTFNHPSVIGKVALFMIPMALPATLSESRRTRMYAFVAIALMFASTFATVSRANIVALAAALGIWLIVAPDKVRLGSRLAVPAVATLAVLPFVSQLVDRFKEDPEGGQREVLLSTGLAFLREHWLFGSGPNFYSETVGQYDSLAARGFPVHNTFLLTAAELGVVLAALFAVPLVAVHVRAVRVCLQPVTPEVPLTAVSHARALLCCAPGMLLIAMTGWGLLAGSILTLWFLSLGYASAAMRESLQESAKGRRARSSVSRSSKARGG